MVRCDFAGVCTVVWVGLGVLGDVASVERDGSDTSIPSTRHPTAHHPADHLHHSTSAPVHQTLDPPIPVAFWDFQEEPGQDRVSSKGFNYSLEDGDPLHPVGVAAGGLFGPRSLNLTASSPSQRLRASRDQVPALTKEIAGPDGKVSVVGWVRRLPPRHPTDNDFFSGFLAGVWGDTQIEARQYAIYFNLGACQSEAGRGTVPGTPRYSHGLAAHASNCGGATPGYAYSMTAACDPRPLEANQWHCVSNVYDGANISAYVNGTLIDNPSGGHIGKVPLPSSVNPYPYPGGIYSPEAHNRTGAEFAVGVAMSFGVNQFRGLLGGLAVFSSALSQTQITAVCNWPENWTRY